MSDRDGRKYPEAGRLELGATIVLGAIFALIVLGSIYGIHARREAIGELPEQACTEGKDCGAKSLKADIQAAGAAQDTVDLAVLQLVLGAAGLYYIAHTLAATRAAVREANDAADAARQAIEHEQQSSRRSLRPYLFVDRPSHYWIFDVNDPDTIIQWRFHAIWKNMGQTPASRIHSRMNFGVMTEPPASVGFEYGDYGDTRSNAAGGAGPGQVFENTVTVAVEDLIKAFDGGPQVYVWAWAEYDDGYPDTPRRRTEWSAHVVPTDDPRKKDCAFHFRIEPRFNGYDGSCEYPAKT